MQIITGTRQFKIEEPTVVTIGKFDGRHKGHQKLLCEMLSQKRRKNLATAVFTFDMAPMGVVKDQPVTVITTNRERRCKLEQMGIDYMVEYPFDKSVAHMSAEDFVRDVLVGQMSAKSVTVGTDCSFGYRGAGDAKLLCELGPKYGFEAVVIEKEQDGYRDISSTYVREQLDLGHIEKANGLLGEPYTILGTVVHGRHMGGRILGFPTVNILPPPEKHLPPFGVYVSQVKIDGRLYDGVTNIGRKPTVEGENPVGVETFLFDMEEDLYGRDIEVQLCHFERPERKFGSLDELRAQIERDKESAAAYLKNMR
ncbi:MAG: bifunctional riboflavin kinase/FAD synthetase [Clostridiales bacterium]|nr:bifunctional riboflavin kinase/FAD synthetase [Clostridiales bacterium]